MENTRNLIVESAISEFLDKGYDGASMESIAMKANLSKGGLYHHFKSKNEILVEVAMKFGEPINGFMESALAAKSPADGLNKYIKHYIEFWLNNREKFTFYTLMTAKALEDEDIARLFLKFNRALIDFFSTLLQRGIESGEFEECDVKGRAAALLSALDGVVPYFLFDPDVKPAKIIKDFQNIFIKPILK